MPDNFFYLFFTLIYFVIWLSLFLLRKDLRKEMWYLGWVFGVAGILSEITFIIDWWQPPTLIGTKLGIEDFLIGFFIGGVAGVAYEALGNKKLVKNNHKAPLMFQYLLLTFTLTFGLAFWAGFHSFYASLIAFIPTTLYIVISRRDLLRDAIGSGLLTLVIGSLTYFSLNVIYPNFIDRWWYLPDYWFSEKILGIPVAEYIWYFFCGAFIGPLYEYIHNLRLKRIGRN